MNGLDPAGAWAFVAALGAKGSLLLLAAFALCAAMRRASAAARHLIWVSTGAALLLLPIATAILPPRELPLMPPLPETLMPGEPAATRGQDRRPVVAAGTAGDFDGAGARPGRSSRFVPVPRRQLVLLLYLTGALAAGSRVLAGLAHLAVLRRRSRPLSCPGWETLLEQVPRGRLARTVELRAVDGLSIPLAAGLLRPAVLLPPGARAWPVATRRDVLVHEVAHLDRFDALAQLVVHLACAVHWCNPLVWALPRRLRQESEQACDDRVLLAGSNAADYADRLLGIARGARGPTPALAAAMALQTELCRRIHTILDDTRRRSTMSRRALLLSTSLSLILLLLVAPLSVGHAGQQEPARQPSAEVTAPPIRGGTTLLLEAVADGDGERVTRLLEQGTNPDESAPGAGTPLILAATAGDLEIVRLLLDAGADPNRAESARPRPDELLRSPLAAAARHGHLQVARRLLAAGADVELTPRGDASPLIEAARGGHPEIVRLLLDAGADADRTVHGDGSPLIAAARARVPAVAQQLIAAGARVDAWVDGDESPLFQAVASGDAEMVRLLLGAGADPNAVWHGDGTPLIVAARTGNDEVVQLLLKAGARPDEGVRGDGNALITAAGAGDLRLVQALLSSGAAPDASVRGDGSPLIAASRSGHLELVELLVESGADVDRMVEGDENPLIQAAWSGHPDVVRYLLDRGADPNARAVEGGRPRGERRVRTPLSMARRAGHAEIVEMLVAAGAVE